jgi:hypothetical protein
MLHRLLLSLWMIWDRVYYLVTRLRYVDKRKRNIFRVVIKRYRGEEITTSDGYTLKAGDWYVQLHFHNAYLAQLLRQSPRHPMSWAAILTKNVRASLPQLTRYINQHPKAAQIQVVLGTTFLYRGAHRLGFEVADIQHLIHRLFKAVSARVVFLMSHPYGCSELFKRNAQLVPKRVYISKEKLNRFHL